MATYVELRQLFSHNELKNRIEVACIVAAESIRTEDGAVTNHANRLICVCAACIVVAALAACFEGC